MTNTDAQSEVLFSSRLLQAAPGTSKRDDVRLALHTFQCESARAKSPKSIPVLLFHGAVGSGRTFYTASGKGLAPFLARAGYVVHVLDFRGHGQSVPSISANFDCSLADSVNEDIPLAVEDVLASTGASALHVMAHSFGGTALLASLARHPSIMDRCVSVITFATRRQLRATSLRKFWIIDVMWNRFALFLASYYGYLPARRFGFGVEPEARTWHANSVRWIREEVWRDAHDGFDYGAAWRAARPRKPALLFLTGGNDPILGNPCDVELLQSQCPAPRSELRVVGTGTGHLHDYDHISLLTHRDAPRDHFPWLEAWLAEVEALEAERSLERP
jgi:predicted alpha/beta hydrolase